MTSHYQDTDHDFLEAVKNNSNEEVFNEILDRPWDNSDVFRSLRDFIESESVGFYKTRNVVELQEYMDEQFYDFMNSIANEGYGKLTEPLDLPKCYIKRLKDMSVEEFEERAIDNMKEYGYIGDRFNLNDRLENDLKALRIAYLRAKLSS